MFLVFLFFCCECNVSLWGEQTLLAVWSSLADVLCGLCVITCAETCRLIRSTLRLCAVNSSSCILHHWLQGVLDLKTTLHNSFYNSWQLALLVSKYTTMFWFDITFLTVITAVYVWFFKWVCAVYMCSVYVLPPVSDGQVEVQVYSIIEIWNHRFFTSALIYNTCDII